ncbi:cleavage and polyadenylation specificity factor subunit [Coprinopsis cinerea okayama7|uniref:Cleavage and polyadenylation specificity factor subunit 2 n=1 Tax=Coprinopsis cinerea (strain Okayama-7 / 130 / ATCC MYA-4618 / FGSC 9003) TaxID=240176 RepID=A8NYN1_COPC7|nr:cleavage and polyadenylation specificity factor subunit [Coprinopsis cinerea okayama7\|eukprot:XP_001837473.1 cleavage and polyadenylation specificity factor subunit [Coprinopsis cinerea okayama7\
MITFTPLAGSAKSKSTTPLSYVLQVDDVRILLDCGSPDWVQEPSPFQDGADMEDDSNVKSTSPPWQAYCEAMKKVAPTIDLVLLSHGDLAHCGLYPWAYSRWGLTAPAYTTLPVQAMGRIAVTEDIEGIRGEIEVDIEEPVEEDAQKQDGGLEVEEQEKALPTMGAKGMCVATLIEVHNAFDSINTLRYSQPIHLQGKCQGLTITPFNAGHSIGGTIWKIRSPSSGTILYAVNLNHMKERHLDGTVMMVRPGGSGVFESLVRPDLLITDAERASVITSRRKDRDAALIDTITATLTSRSSLLLPCDSSTRILELLVLLDQHWNYSRLTYPICLLSRTGREMLTFVRSMMEWLGGTISKEDVGEEGNKRQDRNKRRRDDEDGVEEALGALALRFKHLEFFPNPQALLQRHSSKDPKLILAVPASLSHGPSRQLFADFAAVPDNVVLLTTRGAEGTLGRALFDKWNNSQRGDDKWDKGRIGRNVMMDGAIKIKMYHKVPLQGAELEEYLAKERAAKEKEAAQQAAMARNQRMLEADEDDSDSESDSDSDADDEEEVREALGGDMDVDEAGNRRRRRGMKKSSDGADWGDGDEGYTKQLLSFDIYLKGKVSKSTSFFKSVGGQTQRFRMFPYVEKKRRVDEYGETVDVGLWLRKGKALEEEAEKKEKMEEGATIEEEDKIAEPPSKYVTSEVEVQLACRLLFIDMEGLNDGRAVKTIVPQVNPRRMIVVHASEEATNALIESCGSIKAMTKDILAPVVNESIQIGQQINNFSISISDEMLASLRMSRFEDNEIGYVRGRVVMHSNSIIPILEPASSAFPSSQTPTTKQVLNKRKLGSRPQVALPHSTMIGELKLTALKARLAKVGIQAELVGEGVLICGAGVGSLDNLAETVAVRKVASGRVELEGNVSDVYYTVRKEIYQLHALVAAA